MANLDGEVEEWVTDLHNEGAPELTDLDAFLCGSEPDSGTPHKSDEWRQRSGVSDKKTALWQSTLEISGRLWGSRDSSWSSSWPNTSERD